MNFIPAYLKLSASQLAARAEAAAELLGHCQVCPLKCGARRSEDLPGLCKTGLYARVSSYGPHLGEEQPLRGWRGSGAIFFSGCNLHCIFCQNASISQVAGGRAVQAPQLAAMMLELQAMGCHNINLVSPTHVVPQILAAVQVAAGQGLRLPLVYNSGGYDTLPTLALLDGVVDIYMPDMKYARKEVGRKYSAVPNYPRLNQAAVREMQRQVGDLQIGPDGLARRGLLVLHLVLPNDLAGTQEILRFLAEEISANVYLNLMDQYSPAYQADSFPAVARPISRQEYQRALALASRFGLQRLDDRRAGFDRPGTI